MTDTPQVLLAHHLKTLKLPTFLREYDKLARQCATEGADRRCHVNRHLASLWAPTPEIMQRSSLAATVSIASPRNWRSVRRETRWRWTLKRL